METPRTVSPPISHNSTSSAGVSTNSSNNAPPTSILPNAPFPQPAPRPPSLSSVSASTTATTAVDPAGGINPHSSYENFTELVNKRILTFQYLKRAHEGRVHWFNTVCLSKEDLVLWYQNDRMKRRTGNFFILGASLAPILDITNPPDYVRALTVMLQEFEYHTNENSRQKMKMFFRKSKINKDEDASFQESGEYTYLFVPNIPFELDYFQTFYTLCDILVETYNKFLIDTTNLWSGPFIESVMKVDGKFKKIISMVAKEIDQLARNAIKEELRSVDPMIMMKILLFGSGFVAGPAVEYILRRPENRLTIGTAVRHIEQARALARPFGSRATAISLDVTNEQDLDNQVSKHDLVISLIPYTLHPFVIKSAIKFKKNVVTTSYVSDAIRAFDEAAKEAGITIMNEIGLDPGIDHLYAVKTINEVHQKGGKILSFISYCGGLPAPENSNNPLGYKFSWSSRGVLLALRNSAKYYENGKVVEIAGHDLMDTAKPYHIYPGFAFVAYANRDSTSFKERYNILEAKTIVRGTLRYQGFPSFVKVLVDVGLLDDTQQDHLQPDAPDISWNQVLARLLSSPSIQENDLRAAIRSKASGTIEHDDIERILNGFKWLGLFSSDLVDRRGTLLDTLCATLEDKMKYGEGERDMVLLQHKFEIELKDGTKETQTSTLLAYGNPNGYSAMATTVGTPCGIATQLILDGVISKKGVLAPYSPEINDPIIEALEKEGIKVLEEKL
ncbi:7806_t:CDS:10 [Ambispora leptoticha]|uniref:Saccharopine dehydrogenase [NADP(+), L-glutamate-forming] n=1 Tax=Ambispora leptoticha TaxID=144679 RepID=A0A9N9CZF5_9GLOM|nr:7806_t:CDS:10 [Ambispora leptoticha]